MLLAAGRGARLRPWTDDRPKALLDVGGESIVARTVRLLGERGLTSFTIVDGYRGDMIRAALGDRFPDVRFRFVRNEEWESTNNAYSLHLARSDDDAPMLLLDADIVVAAEALDRLLADPHPNRLALRSRGDLGAEEMKVTVGPDGFVADIGKELPPAAAAGESVGIEVFSSAFTRGLYETLERRVREGPGRREFYEASFVERIRAGERIHPVDLGRHPSVEIDTPDDLAHARALFGSAP